MPEWLRDKWWELAGLALFIGGAAWAALRSTPRRTAAAIRRLHEEQEGAERSIKAAFRRIDEERALREDLKEKVQVGFTRIEGGLDLIRRELEYQRTGHHDQMNTIAKLLGSIENKLEDIHDLDKRLVKLEEQVATITERGCALACPVAVAKGA